MAIMTGTRTGGFNIFTRIAAYRTSFTLAVSQYAKYRNTLAELRNLSRRELDDLGLNAETIRATAYEAAYK